MPNDTPDYQPGANYIAVPLAVTLFDSLHTGNHFVPTGPYTSLLLAINGNPNTLQVTGVWTDPAGNQVGKFTAISEGGFTYLKVPVLGSLLNLLFIAGGGTITVYGGNEQLPLATLVSDGNTVQDGTTVSRVSVTGATVAGTAQVLGTTYASGRVWLSWAFSSTVTGYLQYSAVQLGGASDQVFVATSAEAVTLQGTTTSKWAGFVNLPAQPVAWIWTPQVTAASAACSLALVKG